jgi:D-serine deaminase-like pyridoxal phosphate-dependent protein
VTEVGRKLDELDTPVLWVDLDLMGKNIAYLSTTFQEAGVYWRPHVKGIRIPAVAHKAIAQGAIGVTCATLGEAETMAAAGIRNILIANQIVGPRKALRAASLVRHADVIVAVDGEQNVAELSAAAVATAVELQVVVEVNIGMNRAGVLPGDPAVELSRLVHSTPGLRFVGLMGWEGQTRKEADRNRRRQLIEEAIGQLTRSADACRAAGLPVRIVSAGGTGTYYVTASMPGVTEIQAGGAVFSDVRSQEWGDPTEPSLFVRATVVSRPRPDRIIVDAGFKVLPTAHCQPRPRHDLPMQSLAMSAAHGTMHLRRSDASIRVGDRLDFVVGYGDSTVFLHDRLFGIRDETVEVVWAIRA